FQGQRSALLLKAFVFLIALWFAAASEGGFMPILFFLGSASWAYLTPFENAASHRFTFLALLIASAIAISGTIHELWLILTASIIAYGIFGLKARYFVYRTRIHYFVNLALTYATFFLFFISDRSQWFMPKLVLVGIAIFFSWREFFFAAREYEGSIQHLPHEGRAPRYETVLGAFFALIACEVAWTVSLLPLGAINAANLSFLAAFVMSDVLEKQITGNLSRRAILIAVTIAIFGTIFILGTSGW
ncbi:MAG: hypothetical protein AAB518_02210, partial [Patescibacteria group bacterium]